MPRLYYFLEIFECLFNIKCQMSLQNNWRVLNAIKNNIEHFSIFLLLISISKALVYELMK